MKGTIFERVASLYTADLEMAKANIVKSVYDIIGTPFIRALWIFDAVGSAQTVLDRSGLGHTVTLRNASLTAINASTCSPGISGLSPYITLDANHLWDTPDHNDFSFVEPQPFSIVVLARIANMAGNILFGKYNSDAGQSEYLLYVDPSPYLSMQLDNNLNGAVTFVRAYNESIASQVGSWNTYGGTYSGVVGTANLTAYNNGVRVDNIGSPDASYVAMVNGTAVVGSYVTLSGIFWPFQGAMSVALVCACELTSSQMKELDYILRTYAGVSV